MTTELAAPFKEAKTLVRFSYGNEVVCATLWKSPILLFGLVYEPEPGIEIELPTQSGGLNEDPLKIDLPLTRGKVNSRLQALAARLASTRAFPKLRAEVIQITTVGQEQKLSYLYEGTMERSRRNPEGRAGIVGLEFGSELRYGLDRINLGRRSDPECDVIFGDNGCWHPASRGRQLLTSATYFPNHIPTNQATVCSGWVTVTVDPVNSRNVSLALDPVLHPTPGSPPADPQWRTKTLSEMADGYWIGSFLHDRGGEELTIPIQSWSQGSNIFTLAQTPPTFWDGSVKLLQVGCPRTSAGCDQRFNSLLFGALGFGTPAYNPTLEVAP